MRDFRRSPFIVIWETTRACALACVHCRAEAVPHRDPRELTTAEGRALIDRVRAFGDPPPILVLTGGDPLRRPDIVDLVAYGTARGVSVSLTPSGTAAVTEGRLAALREAGLARLAVSLDGATAEVHDAFRGVRGSHAYTMRIVERARRLGLPLQMNTTVCRRTVGDLPGLARQMEAFGVVLWALFFLIPVGRAQAEQALGAHEIEDVLAWAADLVPSVPFGIKTTEAPHFHRVLAARARGFPDALDREHAPVPRAGVGRAGRAVTDGNGFVFIDHVGDICPSGFLPMPAGNVRRDDLVAVYRDDPLFVSLRDPRRLGGRCGACEHRDACGGSRARAFAVSGDPLAEDPGCSYVPAAASPLPAIAGASQPEPRGAGAAPPAPVTESQVVDALGSVLDPEIGLSVVQLGLIYGIAIEGDLVRITMTLTAQGCPLHAVMTDWVREAIGALPGVARVEVLLTFDPPWTPDRMRVERGPSPPGS